MPYDCVDDASTCTWKPCQSLTSARPLAMKPAHVHKLCHPPVTDSLHAKDAWQIHARQRRLRHTTGRFARTLTRQLRSLSPQQTVHDNYQHTNPLTHSVVNSNHRLTTDLSGTVLTLKMPGRSTPGSGGFSGAAPGDSTSASYAWLRCSPVSTLRAVMVFACGGDGTLAVGTLQHAAWL